MLRPFAGFNNEHIKNEIRALDKICTEGILNIVKVLRHDVFPELNYYYIDMELCDINLEDYLYKSWPTGLVAKGSRYFVSPAYDISIVWEIVRDVACGLAFIHSREEVHRDLKPANGIYYPSELANITKFSIHLKRMRGRLQISA